MNREQEKGREQFNRIQIPDSLDQVIEESITRGTRVRPGQQVRYSLGRIAAGVAAAFLILTVSLNTVPAFAESISGIPGGATLVRYLRFVNNQAGGGQIDDGKDIEDIDILPQSDSERIVIAIGGPDGTAAGQPGRYTITRLEYPYGFIFDMDGARAISAFQELQKLVDSQLIGSVYRIVTLDDSAQRFAVTFKEPVELSVAELQGPARIVIDVHKKTLAQTTEVYSLRTASYGFGEEIGYIETDLRYQYGSTAPRMIMDSAGTFIVEEGYYPTAAAAAARLAELDVPFPLYIEARGPVDIPRAISQ